MSEADFNHHRGTITKVGEWDVKRKYVERGEDKSWKYKVFPTFFDTCIFSPAIETDGVEFFVIDRTI